MKRSSSPRGQAVNQYDSQPHDISTNLATNTESFKMKHSSTSSYGGQTLYEDIHVR